MFRINDLEVVVPQREHARLAGLIAAQWGNERFAPPALDAASFIAGVTLHDWHFGDLDTLPLDTLEEILAGSARRAQWIEVTRRASDSIGAGGDAECVAKHHVRRLLDGVDTEPAREIRRALDDSIAALINESTHSAEDFRWADRLTRVCDLAAFDVFRDETRERRVGIPVRRGSFDEIELTVTNELARAIRFDPWPLSVGRLTAPILAFARAGYPDMVSPRVLMITIEPVRR